MRCRSLLVAGVLAFTASAAQAATVTVDPLRDHYDLVDATEMLEDPSGALTVDSLTRPPFRDRFVPLTRDRRSVGFSRSVFYLRVTLVNSTDEVVHWHVSPSGASMDTRLYTPLEGGGFTEQRLSASLTLYQRAVFLPGFYFSLTLPPRQPTTIIVRVQTPNAIRLSLDLIGDDGILRRMARDWTVFGLFYGAMMALLFYNLFMLGSVGDRAYLYYSIFQLGLICVQLSDDDLAHTFLWPQAHRWRVWGESFFMMIGTWGSLGFARSFLDLASLSSTLDRAARVMQWWALALALACPLSATMLYEKVALGWMPLWCALITMAVWVAWRRGNPNARYFAAGWSVLILASVAVPVSRLGFANATALADVVVKAGALAEAMLLSFGLANRINHIRRDKARVAEELLAYRTAEAQALELRVEERTRELSQTLESLRATQARAIQQERLASLGHIVADVVHEISNPLEFTQSGARELDEELDAINHGLSASSPTAAIGVKAALEKAQKATSLLASGNDRIHEIVTRVRDVLAGRPVE
jgi:hypothetical protein